MDVVGNEISDEESFRVALASLVREAEENGVDVAGGWACEATSNPTEWGIEIYEVLRADR